MCEAGRLTSLQARSLRSVPISGPSPDSGYNGKINSTCLNETSTECTRQHRLRAYEQCSPHGSHRVESRRAEEKRASEPHRRKEAASLKPDPMASDKIKNGHNATEVQLSLPVVATSEGIVKRYKENRDWRLYEKEWIFRNFPPAQRTWLDFGCGTGEITTQLALLGAARVTAIDVTPGLLDMTQKQVEIDGVAERVRTICGDITTAPPEPVDFVLAYAVLHHVPDRLQEVTEAIVRWLKPGGTFIFCEPVCYIPMLEWARNHSAVERDPLDEGERKLTGADLSLIESHFRDAKRVHFNTLRRLSRVIPAADRPLRSIDSALRIVPGSWHFSGNVIGACRK